MKSFRKLISVLLILAIAILPVTALADTGIDSVKRIMSQNPTDDISAPKGTSIYNDVTSETSKGVLCLITFKDDSNMITVSGINGNGKYEIAMYSDLSLVQMLYYSFMISNSYRSIQKLMPSGESFMILVTYGEDGVIIIMDESKADEFRDTILKAVESLANQ